MVSEAQHRRALRDLRLKLLLERRLDERWRRLQRRHARRAARAVASSVIAPDLAALTREEGAPILRRHYGEVWRTFRDDYGARLPSEADGEALDQALAEAFDDRARDQAERIGRTDARDQAAALEIAEAERERVAAEEGSFLAQASVAAIVGATLLRRMQARRPGIASLETQAPAELGKLALKRTEIAAAKLVEDAAQRVIGLPRAAVIARIALGTVTVGGLVTAGAILLSGDEEEPELGKTWVDVGDDVVRPHHSEASGQRVAADEPFLVRGEQLMYPGDASMGAALDNVINCRCSAVYD